MVVGHGALLEGCTIDDHAVIGMGAIVLQSAQVGSGAMVAAGAVVSERADDPAPDVLAAGVPRQMKKELSGSALRWTEPAADAVPAVPRAIYENELALATDDGASPELKEATCPRC